MDKNKLNDFLEQAMLELHEPFDPKYNSYALAHEFKRRLSDVVRRAHEWGVRDTEADKIIGKANQSE